MLDKITVFRHDKTALKLGRAVTMIDETDSKTVEPFPAPTKRRGRPVSGNAKSDAERAREYRLRKKTAPPKPENRDIEISVLRETIKRLDLQLADANQEVGRLTSRMLDLEADNGRLYREILALKQ